jgi:hypothetical protein
MPALEVLHVIIILVVKFLTVQVLLTPAILHQSEQQRASTLHSPHCHSETPRSAIHVVSLSAVH